MARTQARRFTVIFLALVLTSCATKNKGPLQPGADAFPQPGGFNTFSLEQETQIGRQASAEADRQLPLLPPRDPLSDYVSTLGHKLAAQLPEKNYVYSFKVVNQKEINAFALPGGPVYVNVGTVQAASNEAQLAGVIAHEIAHVYMRHATHNASRQMAAQIPIAILGGVLGQGAGGQLARLGLSFGLGSVFMKYSRDAESEADRVGAKIMYEAGYDPRSMAAFFENLEAEGGSRGPQFLSDHPDPGNRAQAVNTAISQLPAKTYQRNSADFTRAKAEVATLKPLSAQQVAQQQQQRQAQVEQVALGSILPSGSYKALDHSQFQIAYPSNWEVMGDRNSAVTIAPRAGVSQDAIAYGVVISGMRPQQAQSLTQSTQQIYQFLRQGNPELRASGGVQGSRINGLEAEVVPLVGPSPLRTGDGVAAEQDMLVTVQRPDGTVVWLLFIAPQAHFERLRPAYGEMLNSLRVQ
jgi:beta-barrel assembly-enhancing protease